MDRDEARLGAHLAIGADPADVMRVAQSHHRDPGLTRFGDADHYCFARGDLAPSALAVIDDQRAVLADNAAFSVCEDGAVREMLQIIRNQADPMAVVAAQIGLDQVVGDDLRLVRLTACSFEEAQCDPLQLRMVDQHH